MRSHFLSLLLPLLLSAANAETPPVAYTDAALAAQGDPDFVVQGEYVGELAGEKVGAQVVAEGGGKFAIVWFPGGLPGDGFKGDLSTRLKGKVEGGKISLPNLTGAVAEGKLSFSTGMLSKVSRQSATLGATPPAGAVVLFDGQSTAAFQAAKLDGATLCQGFTTKEEWGSFTLHVEFRVPYMPTARSQGRGNSGCYLQGRYEVQVLDSFGLEGENNECGGIYTIAKPLINMTYPPLTWQTYDVEYTAATYDAQGHKSANAQVTVKQNGVLIHQQVALTHATTSAPLAEGPGPGPLHFQNHGSEVRYRNLWLVKR